MPHRVFIDGQAGTTGLEIHARLAKRPDIELLEVDGERRKDPIARAELLNAADVVILCLPDDAALEAVALIDNPAVRVLDASTAHRIHSDWAYGLPELARGQRSAVSEARRVANPGCYPTGFLLALRPLIDAGLIRREAEICVHALSGYSGGGRAMVDRYRARELEGVSAMHAPRPYALGLAHKHLPEMQQFAGLAHAPLFTPMVGHYYKGMLVQIPLPPGLLERRVDARTMTELLAERYADEACVHVVQPAGSAALEDGFLDPERCNGTNRVELMVFGDGDQLLLVARLDNLGKGAGGAAIQNMNLMLGIDELAGVAI
ncbi:MAG: N-acetyl-gamma-glutamyl-phosphate reductase [Gammaproteobacteria bacterium]|nr:N-acetyl-gamma-glutamyl-phosphate reductase [Gammaproteobacteria bacterium]